MAVAFHVGQMRSVVVFYRNSAAPLGRGQRDGYIDFLTTRGRLRKKSGARGLEWGEIRSEDGYELICRFQETLATELLVNGKLTVDDAWFTIDNWEKIDQINHIYKFKINTSVGS